MLAFVLVPVLVSVLVCVVMHAVVLMLTIALQYRDVASSDSFPPQANRCTRTSNAHVLMSAIHYKHVAFFDSFSPQANRCTPHHVCTSPMSTPRISYGGLVISLGIGAGGGFSVQGPTFQGTRVNLYPICCEPIRAHARTSEQMEWEKNKKVLISDNTRSASKYQYPNKRERKMN